MDSSFHNILQGQVDPIAWKTELERVGPKLKTNFAVSAHEWRSHVDQTAASKSKIDTIAVDTRKDISSIAVIISEELDRIKKKETHINLSPKTSSLVGYYAENKKEMEVYEKEVGVKNEIVAKYTSELNEIGDKLEELKEAIDAKDNGRSDTSPVLKVKEAVKQIKDEIRVFDLRIGVVSNSLLAAKVAAANRKRLQAAQKSRRRRNREKGHKDEEFDDADDMDEI
jgi:estrogen-related receptor beta like 1